ncbi:ankyrin repeat domain-containing protein 49 [Battus philenor]|uniref:ankyrin repeat domain-containing protein 49 n=1 Tax=Battus philenor TaxID=42288 RepID=UPI0035CF7443
MSDSEDESLNIRNYKEVADEIKRCKRNPATSGMFVSGWDDADQDVDLVKNPKDNPIDYILWAAENGESEVLQELISKHPGLVHAKDSDGYSPLHRAAYGNHLSCIAHLLSAGAKIESKTELGWTPLHSACNWNNYIAVARLLAAGAHPAALSDGGQTPLHLASAISHCRSTIIILLLREDVVDIAHRQNNANETPEQLAYGHGVYGPLFEMALPAANYIRTLSFTCNPHVRSEVEHVSLT